jgi:tight adherence protein C
MSTQLALMAVFFVFVLVAIIVAGRYYLSRGEAAPANASGESGNLAYEDQPMPAAKAALAKALHFMGESMPAARRNDNTLKTNLLKAGFRWPTAITIFHGLRIASALAVAGLVGWSMLLFGFLLPERMLLARVRARGRRIRSAVPPAVDLMVLALESGQSLDQSLQDVARALVRSYPDLCEEFVFCRLEMRAGKSRYEALRHLSDRSPDDELKRLTAVLLDGDRYGTSLGPALRTHARYLRTRIQHGAQESARKLTVKLIFPVFFLIFPSVLLVTLGPAVMQLRESLEFLLNGF